MLDWVSGITWSFLPSEDDAAIELFDLFAHLFLIEPNAWVEKGKIVRVHSCQMRGVQWLSHTAAGKAHKHSNNIEPTLGKRLCRLATSKDFKVAPKGLCTKLLQSCHNGCRHCAFDAMRNTVAGSSAPKMHGQPVQP